MATFIFLAMIFLHIFDDFFLQSAFLANGKQKGWWKKNAPEPQYKYDYIPCLLSHAFSWTFMMMLPLAWWFEFMLPTGFLVAFIINFFVHAFIDHCKANKRWINLIFDQSVHIIQIIITFTILMEVIG